MDNKELMQSYQSLAQHYAHQGNSEISQLFADIAEVYEVEVNRDYEIDDIEAAARYYEQ